MQRLLSAVVVLLALGAAGNPWVAAITPSAAQPATARTQPLQTATFTIENMTCALCPVTVRKAIEAVAGVQAVTVNFDAKTATVVFNPAATTPDAIAAASTNAGYPARAQKQAPAHSAAPASAAAAWR